MESVQPHLGEQAEEPDGGATSMHPQANQRSPEEPSYRDPILLDPCQEAIATLYSFLDGELTSERRALIQRHLDDCAPCFEAFGFEAELKSLVARKCRDDVPQSLRLRVAEALRAEARRV
ncbi:MAG TPA: mycothiol system anti-sigma-R factor [Acidimicrobiales bacterium]|nr:mycothiol system anti-sigma-R factor [Acidimicrobiales bacterium]